MDSLNSLAPWILAGGTIVGGIVAAVKSRDDALKAKHSVDSRLDEVENRLEHLEGQHKELLLALESKASKRDLQELHQDLKGDLREVRGILLGVARNSNG